jgi:toxin ParE1/3/4
MNIPVVLSPAADQEFEAAAAWYEEQKAQLGTEFVEEVQEALDRIGRMPDLPVVLYRNIRRVRVTRFPYNIFYRIHIDRIEVIAVLHSHRNPSDWKSRA